MISSLGYEFKNMALEQQALTHSSLLHENKMPGPDNQRLEFLGDAVLQLTMTEHLYQLFPDFSEGRLTKLRAALVNRYVLEKLAIKLDLGNYLLLGKGEDANGGRKRSSNLADAMEAVIGAVYLDSGIECAREVIHTLFADDIEAMRQAPREVNPKGELQEMLQAKSHESPVYEIVSAEGRDHDKTFEARVLWQGTELGRGSGHSKKQAEIDAALNALLGLELAKNTEPNP